LLAYCLTKVARAYLGPEGTPRRIETAFYGGLQAYANWLLAPVVLGLSSDFDPLFDFQEAADYLAQKGISHENRSVDDRKQYGMAMTIDLFQQRGNTVTKVSVRGTVAEGRPMVSRINDFDRLYYEPRGFTAMVTYRDQPGMLAKICGVMARHQINIDDIHAPRDAKSGEALAVLKLNQPVTPEILDEVLRQSGARSAVGLDIK
jgi:hypothetical protein